MNEEIQENIQKARKLAMEQRKRDKGKRLVKVGHNLWHLVSEKKYKEHRSGISVK